MDKMNKLIEVIAKSGNEEVQATFLEWQDEGIRAKEKFIKKLDKMLKKSDGKEAETSQDQALNLACVIARYSLPKQTEHDIAKLLELKIKLSEKHESELGLTRKEYDEYQQLEDWFNGL